MITVLMATYNGAGTLPRVLDAYLRITPPASGWRLVVVDNASADRTPEVLREFAGRLPLRHLRTEARGKNLALNLGLAELEGELVVLTDDDAVPAPDWLLALERAAAAHPDYDIFGGEIDPVWPATPPEWIARLVNMGATFAITPDGCKEGPIAAAQIWGPNMAVRRQVFAQGHRFNEGIGPQAGQYIMGSEVEFTCRLERLGHKAWFVPDAVVGHIIRPHQVDRAWIIQRAYRLGRHMYHQESAQIAVQGGLLLGSPRWKYRRLLTEYLRAAAGWIKRDFDTKFCADWEISFLHGYLSEGRQAATAGSARQ